MEIGKLHPDSSTATNCEQVGHCWHPGTTANSWCCCRCGMHWYPAATAAYGTQQVLDVQENVPREIQQDLGQRIILERLIQV